MVAGTYEISLLVLILFSPQREISYLRVAVETFSEDQIWAINEALDIHLDSSRLVISPTIHLLFGDSCIVFLYLII